MELFRIIPVVMSLTMAGCTTDYEAYGSTGGYKDKEISAGKYEVYFLGNGITSDETVSKFWHLRAKELCGGEYIYEYTDTNIQDYTIHAGAAPPLNLSYPQVSGVVECKNRKQSFS
ncbi:MAG: hypothetical protein QNK26_12000 [Moritella sp.]|uniref:CC0125/CC1285 family lipoprotein n=1 Tax=Moritella sp. TaxID=78556 RepID=UPI0029AF0B0F|nr:hypothetical protein [Moritella sp.]MDX2321302.1 hypothetical protein [Moritella sp.]